jgi:hypothetical protein
MATIQKTKRRDVRKEKMERLEREDLGPCDISAMATSPRVESSGESIEGNLKANRLTFEW